MHYRHAAGARSKVTFTVQARGMVGGRAQSNYGIAAEMCVARGGLHGSLEPYGAQGDVSPARCARPSKLCQFMSVGTLALAPLLLRIDEPSCH